MIIVQGMDRILSLMKSRINLLLAVSVFVVASPLRAEESLSWRQCVTETREAHPDLSSAFALLQQAEATKNITGGSLLPQLSLGMNSLQRGSSGSGSSLLSSYSLSAKQLLYDGHKTSSQVASNNEAIMAAQYNYGAVSAAVRFALKSSFTALLKAQNLVGLTIEIAERRQKNVRLITLRYQGGRENIGSLRQAEADLAQAEFEVAQAKRGLVFAQTALASALGRDTHSALRVQGAFKAGDLSTEKPDLALLVKRNPQFQQLNARTKAARYDFDATKSTFSPQLYLTSSVGRSSPDRWPVDAVDWNAGLSLSIPIYEGGSGGARVARARAVVDQQSAQEKSGFLQLLDALELSWKSFQDARQAVVVRKKFLDAAVERATIASAQYSNGLISFNDWVVIEDKLVSTKKEYLNAGADMLIAEAQWIQSKGGGLDGQQE
jgi:outer membrane protein TolC